MNAPQILSAIKSTVNLLLPGSKVLLFGSRATGTEDVHSDYDLLIITHNTFSAREKMSWENKIRKTLVYSLNAPFDIILQSEGEIEEN